MKSAHTIASPVKRPGNINYDLEKWIDGVDFNNSVSSLSPLPIKIFVLDGKWKEVSLLENTDVRIIC